MKLFSHLLFVLLVVTTSLHASTRSYLNAIGALHVHDLQQTIHHLGAVHSSKQRTQIIAAVLEEYGDTLPENTQQFLLGMMKTLSPDERAEITKALVRYRERMMSAEPVGKDILLVINFNHPHYENMKELKKVYQEQFPHIVFYGPERYPGVELCEHYFGFYSYQVIAMAMEKYPHYKGYLFVHDDCVINFWNFRSFDKDKIWYSSVDMYAPFDGAVDTKIAWWPFWENAVFGREAVKKIYPLIPEKNRQLLIKNCGGEPKALGGFSDIAYVPRKYAQDYIALSNIFVQGPVFLEIALPMILFAIEDKSNFYYFDGMAIWWDDRAKTAQFYHRDIDYIHAIKMSDKKLWAFIKSELTKYKASVPLRFPLIQDNTQVYSYKFNRSVPPR